MYLSNIIHNHYFYLLFTTLFYRFNECFFFKFSNAQNEKKMCISILSLQRDILFFSVTLLITAYVLITFFLLTTGLPISIHTQSFVWLDFNIGTRKRKLSNISEASGQVFFYALVEKKNVKSFDYLRYYAAYSISRKGYPVVCKIKIFNMLKT